jgi:hypothetical protein
LREGLGRLAAFVSGLKGEPVVRTAAVSVPIETEVVPVEAVPTEPEQRPAFSRV